MCRLVFQQSKSCVIETAGQGYVKAARKIRGGSIASFSLSCAFRVGFDAFCTTLRDAYHSVPFGRQCENQTFLFPDAVVGCTRYHIPDI